MTGGVYGQVSREVHGFTFEAGGRLDRTSGSADRNKANLDLYQAYHQTQSTARTDTYFSGKLRMTMNLGSVRIGAGIGHTARPPDPQERYYALARMGSDWVGNPDLPVVRNTGLRVDAGYRTARLVIDGAVQHDFVGDFITPYAQARRVMVPGVMNSSARSFANVDARITSVEARGSYSFDSRWSATATASSVRGSKRADPSRRITTSVLSEIPPLRGELTVRHDRGRVFGEAAWTLSARQSRVDTDLGERPVPSSGVLSVRAGLRLSHVRATVALRNVFDHWYHDALSFQRDPFRSGVAVYEPGRTLHGSVALAW